MDTIERINLKNKIINKLKAQGISIKFTGDPEAYALLKEKEIYLTVYGYVDPTEEDLFDLLHEAGHIFTNKPGMKRYEEEYYATVWAIKEAKKYGIQISQQRKREFQIYINNWRKTSIKHHAKNVMDAKDVLLKW